jgi:hypothetical protein
VIGKARELASSIPRTARADERRGGGDLRHGADFAVDHAV